MKTMFKVICILSLLSFGGIGQVIAQYSMDPSNVCGVTVSLPPSDQVGGRYIPSATPGSFFRVMVIFAQFPDDNWNTSWSEWPKG